MKPFFFLLFLAVIMWQPGCTNKEPVYRSVYEGLRMREQLINPSDDPCAQPLPRYDEYKEERELILKPEPPAKE